MDDPITLQRARGEDVAVVVALCLAVERQHEGYWPLRWGLRADIGQRYERWLQRVLNDPNWLVLCAWIQEPQPQIVGVLVAAIQDEIPIYTFERYAFIHDMAVQATWRRRGVGRQLLQAARQWASEKGVDQLRAMVAAANQPAQELFARAGYRNTYREMVLPTNEG